MSKPYSFHEGFHHLVASSLLHQQLLLLHQPFASTLLELGLLLQHLEGAEAKHAELEKAPVIGRWWVRHHLRTTLVHVFRHLSLWVSTKT